jgi:glycosyltransferase involved in cell wall biosynthesis
VTAVAAQSMSVVQTVASLDSRAGGVSRAVPQLSDALCAQDCHVAVVYVADGTQPGALVLPERAAHHGIFGINLARRRLWSPRFAHQIAQAFVPCAPRLLHDNGLWGYTNYAAARFALRHRIPLVISPHGMLEPWAMQAKRFRKGVALAVFQRKTLQSAALLMATADTEYESVRHAGLVQPVTIIPIGVALPSTRARHDDDSTTRKILFLSRIHPKKGLLALVEAWHRVRQPGWKIIIAGPDEAGHLAQVREMTRRFGLESEIEFYGEVTGAEKSRLFEGADIFALPTFSENFGVVVAEAMSYALPVLTTRGAPWSVLDSINAGWWVEPGVDGLAEGLRRVLATSVRERRAMGQSGRTYVAEKLGWGSAGRMAYDAYAWVLGLRSDRPDHVRID